MGSLLVLIQNTGAHEHIRRVRGISPKHRLMKALVAQIVQVNELIDDKQPVIEVLIGQYLFSPNHLLFPSNNEKFRSVKIR